MTAIVSALDILKSVREEISQMYEHGRLSTCQASELAQRLNDIQREVVEE